MLQCQSELVDLAHQKLPPDFDFSSNDRHSFQNMCNLNCQLQFSSNMFVWWDILVQQLLYLFMCVLDVGTAPGGLLNTNKNRVKKSINDIHIDGLMQKRRNSIADALELRLFCIRLTMCLLEQWYELSPLFYIDGNSCTVYISYNHYAIYRQFIEAS